MAVPAALAVRAALATVSDKNARTAAASLIAALFVPFFLIIAVLLSALAGTADHNKAAVDLTFHGGYLSSAMPADYRGYIKKMRESFSDLDAAVVEINAVAEDGGADATRIKAIFYSLFFGADQPRMKNDDYCAFADCFMEYEEREGDEGNVYTVAVPIVDLETVYENLEILLGQKITEKNKINAQRIYLIAVQGAGSYPDSGESLSPGTGMGDGSFSELMAEATKYIGYPYIMGGSSPATGFDCSGFICWVYTKSGVYHLPRTTAQGIYNQCVKISKEEARPGDLIFFTKTYATSNTVSHVGIYVGDGKMLHCGSPVGYADFNSAYWKSHFYGMGRLLQ